MKMIAVALLVLTLASCGDKGDLIIFDKRVGPLTKAQEAELPSGLVGDPENAVYSGMPAKGKGMEDPEGVDAVPTPE